jgi:hypothetical protein
MSGVDLIAAERQRQIEQEGFDAVHDDTTHQDGSLAAAGAMYALHAGTAGVLDNRGNRKWVTLGQHYAPLNWPWEIADWKPSEHRIADLVKAGALIAAEIDRLERQPPRPVKLKRGVRR